MASSSGDVVAEENFFDDTDDIQEIEETPQRKPKIRRIRLKKKLQAYRERKARLAASWVDIRQGLVSALLYRQALQEGQKCVIPSCGKDAFGRCLHCGPGQLLCEEHIETVHAGGRSLHYPEFWKDGRYLPYALHECIWTTPHNNDHGYIREITAIGITGQHAIKVKFCEHEAEASTLVRNGFWPSSPKQPQVAFDQGYDAPLLSLSGVQGFTEEHISSTSVDGSISFQSLCEGCLQNSCWRMLWRVQVFEKHH